MKPSRSLVLVVTGSIAAVKTLPLIGALRSKNFDVSVILTRAPETFGWVTCDTLRDASVESVLTNVSAEEEKSRLLNGANAVLVAPASADFLSRMTYERSPFIQAIVNASASPRHLMVAPAMNTKMWEHPAVQRNVSALNRLGAVILGPVSGALACGVQGFGRMADPELLACGSAAACDGQPHETLAFYDLARRVKTARPAFKKNGHILIALGGRGDEDDVRRLASSVQRSGLTADYVLAPSWKPRAARIASIVGQDVVTDYGQVDGLDGLEHIRLPERAGCVFFPFLDQETAQNAVHGQAGSLFLALILASKAPVAAPSSRFAALPSSLAQSLHEDGWVCLDDFHDILASRIDL
ncbi:MAG: flavoprotein [Alphaproteobacteria bacterium]|nr:flavoprotein [Alphaproteobacteria bacterium]